ncbi:ComEC/Rec2 family competence protein [Propionimicrobium sp. PCR01-08-3]|uniref:ComEC/Rec2 family competence protein n=1 Tax=Propionimicrobium sp. PCR01-08-3 TaxID=3052086 RepID=UPI00255C33D4|nr:ComEC/Rec2 family competence protein [Propionimicrobium sp. PCR01-08-3]WIY83593.1 ComEC/Rec2 family competence protein [Propionimicrobium sp. PCR01-08-3]
MSGWAAAGVAVQGGRWVGLAIGMGIVFGSIGLLRRAWTISAVGIAVTGVGMVAGLWVTGLDESLPAQWARDEALVEVTAEVTSDARQWQASGFRPAAGVLPLNVNRVVAHGEEWQGSLPAQLRASGEAAALLDQPVGATVSFIALSRAPEEAERSVATLVLRSEIDAVTGPGTVAAIANRFREGLRQAMARSPTEQAGLVPSLVVGDISNLPQQVKDDFKTTGLTHLTAVSGTNLTLMLAFSLGVARQLGVRGWWLRGMGVVVAFCFIIVCRAEPSVLRAAAMGLIAMAATGVAHDRARGLRALSLAILVLVLIDPWLSRSWGFALSVGATAGILWWAGRWQTMMRGWAPGWLAESLAVPLAAQLATQPIVTALSGQVSIVGLAANVFAGPFVGPVTILGLAAGLVSLVWPGLAILIGWAAGWCVQPIVLIARVTASAPEAAWSWRSTPASLALLGVGCVVIAEQVVPRILAKRLLACGVAFLMVLGAFRSPPQAGWPAQWAVVACDVGQGGAQLIRTGPKEAILVDTGPEPTALRGCLSSVGVSEISLLVLTHSHADHVGGLSSVVGELPVDMVLVGSDSPDPSALTGLPEPIRTDPGDRIEVGSVTWTTVAAGGDGPSPGAGSESVGERAGDDSAGEDSGANDASVTGIIDTGEMRVLVTGDLEVAGQQAALDSGADLRVDVLVVPHHGSSKQDVQFIEATQARIALIQVGENNGYGHPASSTLSMLNHAGVEVFRTDEQGAIAVSADGREVVTQH